MIVVPRKQAAQIDERLSIVSDNALWKNQPVPVTGILITYNQESYITDALSSVLQQTYPMDLIVSDDCSVDRTLDVMRTILSHYQGHHRIRLRAGPCNLGVCGNQNASISLAEGELIVLFEGDDKSVPDRVQRLVEAYVVRKRAVAGLGSAVLQMDSNDCKATAVPYTVRTGDAWTIFRGGWAVPGCGLAFRRDCFFEIGPISEGLISGDIALWMRAAFVRNGGMLQVPDALVYYRRHAANVSKRFTLEFSSTRVLRACCRNLLRNEVAQVLELRKIARYLRRAGSVGDEVDTIWEAHFCLAKSRAKLVLAVSRKSRMSWIWPALVATRFPMLRGRALRVIALAIFPWVRVLYMRIPSLSSLVSTFSPPTS
jgi:glycosyltransferase involved in cell wall biosynthesis